jgi:xylulokinase
MLGVPVQALSDLALQAPAGADGLVMVPYLEGERTPNEPEATGAVHGLTLANSTPAHLARAAVEGMLCALADGLDALIGQGTEAKRIILIGGGAKSVAVQQIAPSVFGRPVTVPPENEYVAEGAARQAAWALTGSRPQWTVEGVRHFDGAPQPSIRERFAQARSLFVSKLDD